jgi:hypothetical protein
MIVDSAASARRPASPSEAAAITAALNNICAAVDGADRNRWVDCFLADGTFTWAPTKESGPVLDLAGADELAAWFDQHRSARPVGTQIHVLNNPYVTIDANGAAVESSYLTLRSVAGRIEVASCGRYVDRLLCGGDGEWRIARREAVSIGMDA